MADINQLETELNQMITRGEGFPSGFDKFYADDVVMIEGNGDRCTGKQENRKRELDFFGMVKELHSARLIAAASTGDISFSEWEYDMTFQDGNRVTLQEIARRVWKDGRIIEERFYYNAAAMGG